MEEASSWLRLRHQMCSWRRSSRFKSPHDDSGKQQMQEEESTGASPVESVDGRLAPGQLEFCAGQRVRWSRHDDYPSIDTKQAYEDVVQIQKLATDCHIPELSRNKPCCPTEFERPNEKFITTNKLSYIDQVSTTLRVRLELCNAVNSCVHAKGLNLTMGTSSKRGDRKILLLSPIVILLLVTIGTLFVSIHSKSTTHLAASAYQLTNNLIANNLPPKFVTATNGQASNSEIVVRVKEGPASIGKLIYTLRGEDPDDDPLTFGVLGSMASDLLRIENVPGNQANVYLRKELDRETTESYQMVITLSDGKLGRGNWVSGSFLICNRKAQSCAAESLTNLIKSAHNQSTSNTQKQLTLIQQITKSMLIIVSGPS